MKGYFKVLTIVICILLIAAFFSSCKENEGLSDSELLSKEEIKKLEQKSGGINLPIDKKGTEISAVVVSNEHNLNESVIIKELSRRTGLKLNVIPIENSVLDQKIKVLVASKSEMPDIMMNYMDIFVKNELGMQGAFEPINKHINELPNFKRIFVDEAEKLETTLIMNSGVASDGNLYFFPNYDISRDVNYGMIYRKDIFDKHGLKMWNSTEEFYQTLNKLKELYPNSTPLTTYSESLTFLRFARQWGIHNIGTLHYNKSTNKWEQSATSDTCKQVLDFLKKLYNEGLLDPEFLTRTGSSWTQLMSKPDSAFVSWAWIGKMPLLNSQSTIPNYDLRFAYSVGPEGKIEPKQATTLHGPCIKKSDNSLLALKLCDYLLSEGGAELMTMGIEGETYTMGEDGYAKYIGFNENPSFTSLQEKYGLFLEGLKFRTDRRSCYFNFNEHEKEAQDMMNNKPGGGFHDAYPDINYTKEENDIIKKDLSRLNTAFLEFATKYVLNKDMGDSDWTEWVRNAKSTFNIEETEVLANEVQNRMK